jgi:hypothetical protein
MATSIIPRIAQARIQISVAVTFRPKRTNLAWANALADKLFHANAIKNRFGDGNPRLVDSLLDSKQFWNSITPRPEPKQNSDNY